MLLKVVIFTLEKSTAWAGNCLRTLGVLLLVMLSRDLVFIIFHIARLFSLVFKTDLHDKLKNNWLAIYGECNKRLKLLNSFNFPAVYYKLDTFDLHCYFWTIQ